MHKGDSKENQLTIELQNTPFLWLVHIAADLSSHWMKTAATASSEMEVFSNIEQCMFIVCLAILFFTSLSNPYHSGWVDKVVTYDAS